MNQLFQQVRILNPIGNSDGNLTERVADLLVIDGIIQEVSDTTLLPTDLETIPGGHLILAPGLVDLYSHSGTPGHEERETLTSLLQSAQAGGFRSLNILPDTLPALDRASSIVSLDREYQQIAVQMPNCPQLGYWSALTVGVEGTAMTELAELATTNITGWADGRSISNPALICRILEYLQPFNRPIGLYALDRQLRGNGVARAGVAALKYGLPVDPVSSETAALAQLIEIIAEVGTPVHLMRISTRRGVELVTAAKQRGVPITASTTWLHLIANTTALATYDPNFKLNPPLGNPSDQIALIEGIKTGAIDAIAIDHHAYTYEEKTVAFGEAPAGAIGLELALPLLWANLVVPGKLSALELWAALSTNPARCLHQSPPTQSILFDPQQTWVVTKNSLKSLSHNTAWLGREIVGKVNCDRALSTR
ncbi:dihydroorotase [Chamaesiphon sp. GL140_3_metabinner_50]|uniref:dihydroorotase n=1 Tax=Chamaesiphon sp. GL140_3_metabinner_50 TaxID=2970812 RepID=UPI0025EBB8EC|nr:dihydroorotase [Chamaesiphon sp. GL140_3_metabinner_50]